MDNFNERIGKLETEVAVIKQEGDDFKGTLQEYFRAAREDRSRILKHMTKIDQRYLDINPVIEWARAKMMENGARIQANIEQRVSWRNKILWSLFILLCIALSNYLGHKGVNEWLLKLINKG